MSGPQIHTITPQSTTVAEDSPRSPRLSLKPRAHTTGFVDGAWWPRSRDLPAELPELAAGLGRIERVTYNLSTWDVSAPRRVDVDGHQVRLEGFDSQHPHTVNVITADRHRLTLMVVPPESTPAFAEQSLAMASQRDNVDSVDELIAGGDTTPARPEPLAVEAVDAVVPQWTLGGGRLYELVSDLSSRTVVQRSLPRDNQYLR